MVGWKQRWPNKRPVYFACHMCCDAWCSLWIEYWPKMGHQQNRIYSLGDWLVLVRVISIYVCKAEGPNVPIIIITIEVCLACLQLVPFRKDIKVNRRPYATFDFLTMTIWIGFHRPSFIRIWFMVDTSSESLNTRKLRQLNNSLSVVYLVNLQWRSTSAMSSSLGGWTRACWDC